MGMLRFGGFWARFRGGGPDERPFAWVIIQADESLDRQAESHYRCAFCGVERC